MTAHDATSVQLQALAEDAWLLRFGDSIDPAVNARVHVACTALSSQLAGAECVPAYASLLLRLDPAPWLDAHGQLDEPRLRQDILAALAHAHATPASAREIVIPVCYGGDEGGDIADVAAHARLSVDEVVARHSAATYRVAMLGFAPGFPYLLGLDPALAMPRRGTPRTRVPAGSVAIGGQQTGIYPQALPGGWQLIGRTPLRLFDVDHRAPSLLQPGDTVRFRPIDRETYAQLSSATDVAS